ncbi:hypothetical protein JW964_21535 [candidate division KSB1 bacterium]|nr:hypothetical protein [candidate division KSB1 bacterium]
MGKHEETPLQVISAGVAMSILNCSMQCLHYDRRGGSKKKWEKEEGLQLFGNANIKQLIFGLALLVKIGKQGIL